MMALTLWNEFKQNEGTLLANTIASGNVLIAMRLKVTTFGCELNLQTYLH